MIHSDEDEVFSEEFSDEEDELSSDYDSTTESLEEGACGGLGKGGEGTGASTDSLRDRDLHFRVRHYHLPQSTREQFKAMQQFQIPVLRGMLARVKKEYPVYIRNAQRMSDVCLTPEADSKSYIEEEVQLEQQMYLFEKLVISTSKMVKTLLEFALGWKLLQFTLETLHFLVCSVSLRNRSTWAWSSAANAFIAVATRGLKPHAVPNFSLPWRPLAEFFVEILYHRETPMTYGLMGEEDKKISIGGSIGGEWGGVGKCGSGGGHEHDGLGMLNLLGGGIGQHMSIHRELCYAASIFFDCRAFFELWEFFRKWAQINVLETTLSIFVAMIPERHCCTTSEQRKLALKILDLLFELGNGQYSCNEPIKSLIGEYLFKIVSPRNNLGLLDLSPYSERLFTIQIRMMKIQPSFSTKASCRMPEQYPGMQNDVSRTGFYFRSKHTYLMFSYIIALALPSDDKTPLWNQLRRFLRLCETYTSSIASMNRQFNEVIESFSAFIQGFYERLRVQNLKKCTHIIPPSHFITPHTAAVFTELLMAPVLRNVLSKGSSFGESWVQDLLTISPQTFIPALHKVIIQGVGSGFQTEGPTISVSLLGQLALYGLVCSLQEVKATVLEIIREVLPWYFGCIEDDNLTAAKAMEMGWAVFSLAPLRVLLGKKKQGTTVTTNSNDAHVATITSGNMTGIVVSSSVDEEIKMDSSMPKFTEDITFASMLSLDYFSLHSLPGVNNNKNKKYNNAEVDSNDYSNITAPKEFSLTTVASEKEENVTAICLTEQILRYILATKSSGYAQTVFLFVRSLSLAARLAVLKTLCKRIEHSKISAIDSDFDETISFMSALAHLMPEELMKSYYEGIAEPILLSANSSTVHLSRHVAVLVVVIVRCPPRVTIIYLERFKRVLYTLCIDRLTSEIRAHFFESLISAISLSLWDNSPQYDVLPGEIDPVTGTFLYLPLSEIHVRWESSHNTHKNAFALLVADILSYLMNDVCGDLEGAVERFKSQRPTIDYSTDEHVLDVPNIRRGALHFLSKLMKGGGHYIYNGAYLHITRGDLQMRLAGKLENVEGTIDEFLQSSLGVRSGVRIAPEITVFDGYYGRKKCWDGWGCHVSSMSVKRDKNNKLKDDLPKASPMLVQHDGVDGDLDTSVSDGSFGNSMGLMVSVGSLQGLQQRIPSFPSPVATIPTPSSLENTAAVAAMKSFTYIPSEVEALLRKIPRDVLIQFLLDQLKIAGEMDDIKSMTFCLEALALDYPVMDLWPSGIANYPNPYKKIKWPLVVILKAKLAMPNDDMPCDLLVFGNNINNDNHVSSLCNSGSRCDARQKQRHGGKGREIEDDNTPQSSFSPFMDLQSIFDFLLPYYTSPFKNVQEAAFSLVMGGLLNTGPRTRAQLFADRLINYVRDNVPHDISADPVWESRLINSLIYIPFELEMTPPREVIQRISTLLSFDVVCRHETREAWDKVLLNLLLVTVSQAVLPRPEHRWLTETTLSCKKWGSLEYFLKAWLLCMRPGIPYVRLSVLEILQILHLFSHESRGVVKLVGLLATVGSLGFYKNKRMGPFAADSAEVLAYYKTHLVFPGGMLPRLLSAPVSKSGCMPMTAFTNTFSFSVLPPIYEEYECYTYRTCYIALTPSDYSLCESSIPVYIAAIEKLLERRKHLGCDGGEVSFGVASLAELLIRLTKGAMAGPLLELAICSFRRWLEEARASAVCMTAGAEIPLWLAFACARQGHAMTTLPERGGSRGRCVVEMKGEHEENEDDNDHCKMSAKDHNNYNNNSENISTKATVSSLVLLGQQIKEKALEYILIMIEGVCCGFSIPQESSNTFLNGLKILAFDADSGMALIRTLASVLIKGRGQCNDKGHPSQDEKPPHLGQIDKKQRDGKVLHAFLSSLKASLNGPQEEFPMMMTDDFMSGDGVSPISIKSSFHHSPPLCNVNNNETSNNNTGTDNKSISHQLHLTPSASLCPHSRALQGAGHTQVVTRLLQALLYLSKRTVKLGDEFVVPILDILVTLSQECIMGTRSNRITAVSYGTVIASWSANVIFDHFLPAESPLYFKLFSGTVEPFVTFVRDQIEDSLALLKTTRETNATITVAAEHSERRHQARHIVYFLHTILPKVPQEIFEPLFSLILVWMVEVQRWVGPSDGESIRHNIAFSRHFALRQMSKSSVLRLVNEVCDMLEVMIQKCNSPNGHSSPRGEGWGGENIYQLAAAPVPEGEETGRVSDRGCMNGLRLTTVPAEVGVSMTLFRAETPLVPDKEMTSLAQHSKATTEGKDALSSFPTTAASAIMGTRKVLGALPSISSPVTQTEHFESPASFAITTSSVEDVTNNNGTTDGVPSDEATAVGGGSASNTETEVVSTPSRRRAVVLLVEVLEGIVMRNVHRIGKFDMLERCFRVVSGVLESSKPSSKLTEDAVAQMALAVLVRVSSDQQIGAIINPYISILLADKGKGGRASRAGEQRTETPRNSPLLLNCSQYAATAGWDGGVEGRLVPSPTLADLPLGSPNNESPLPAYLHGPPQVRCAVKVLCAVLVAYPDSIPPFCGRAILALRPYFLHPLCDLKNSVSRTFKFWWRAHKDLWDTKYKKEFNAREVAMIQDLVYGLTNYYA